MTERDVPIPAAPTQRAILPDRITLIAFLAFIIVSGGASVAIRFTYAELPTFWSGAARFICVTITAFLLYLFVLKRWTASGTSYAFVLIPLVTIVMAGWLANEQITWQFLPSSDRLSTTTENLTHQHSWRPQ